jgi:hypothetical protein
MIGSGGLVVSHFLWSLFSCLWVRLGTRKKYAILDVISIVEGSNIKYAWKLELL